MEREIIYSVSTMTDPNKEAEMGAKIITYGKVLIDARGKGRMEREALSIVRITSRVGDEILIGADAIEGLIIALKEAREEIFNQPLM